MSLSRYSKKSSHKILQQPTHVDAIIAYEERMVRKLQRALTAKKITEHQQRQVHYGRVSVVLTGGLQGWIVSHKRNRDETGDRLAKVHFLDRSTSVCLPSV